MIRKYIEKIGENKNIEDMKKLGDMLADIIYSTKESHPDLYKKYKTKLIGMAYNYQIDKELAHEIVEDMKPLGEYWSMETIASVIGNDTHRLEDMYVVMNSLANDYQNVVSLDNVETYIKMAHAWLDDVDQKEHKLWKYFIG